jgi:hypothetical protein
MGTSTAGFYITGGTVPPGTPSYAERKADRDRFDCLGPGAFRSPASLGSASK